MASTAFDRSAFRSPPQTLIAGHHGAWKADKLAFLETCAREYGDIVPLRFGPVRFWIVSVPEIIGEVLTTRAGSFRKDIGLRRTKVLLGNGLLTSEGDEHARRSHIAQPAFRAKEVERYAPGMVDLAEKVVAGWRDGATIDVAAEMSRLTLAIVARALFGADMLREAGEIGEALTEVLALMADRINSWIPVPLSIPTPANRRFLRARAVLDAAVLRMIADRRRAGGAGDDLLSRLLAVPEGGGHGLTDEQLRDEVMTLFLAGHETTANGLAFTLYLLSRNAEAARRARAEAEAVLGTRRATAADVHRLELVQACFEEGIRIFPPAWMLGRQAAEDVVLGDGRLHVRAGELVAMSPYLVHRDARHWPDPMAFRPERFARSAPRPAPWTYFPFGGGKRACIGRSFALLEAGLILGTILRRAEVVVDPGYAPRLAAHITLRAVGGMPATVRLRAPVCPAA